ncbi:MAG: hypothetical protein JO271_11330 [Verrucomicrobia bacterium]|nr:hypothetical protein [Verrucomicrobiota bacterium]
MSQPRANAPRVTARIRREWIQEMRQHWVHRDSRPTIVRFIYIGEQQNSIDVIRLLRNARRVAALEMLTRPSGFRAPGSMLRLCFFLPSSPLIVLPA